jgi:hypothetical protein
MNSNIRLRTVFSLLLIIVLIIDGFYIYSYVLSHVKVNSKHIFISDGHYVPMSVRQAIYYTCYSAALFISTIGLGLRKNWAYLLFQILALPVIAGLVFDSYLNYDGGQKIPIINWIFLIAIVTLVFLVNRYRNVLVNVASKLKKRDVAILMIGLVTNIGLYFIVLYFDQKG